MKSRQLTFYAEPAAVESTMATITNVVLQAEVSPAHQEANSRRELTVMSFWSDGLEGSEATSKEFIAEVHRVAGTNPVRKSFDLLKAMWRDIEGDEVAQFP
jgi:hypothetical protein